ncbi:MAG: hypothetical protein IPN43_18910 [Chitinophagaceae bacterium]|nr:hypothetical protein [Chitinophagaceae bacterium]
MSIEINSIEKTIAIKRQTENRLKKRTIMIALFISIVTFIYYIITIKEVREAKVEAEIAKKEVVAMIKEKEYLNLQIESLQRKFDSAQLIKKYIIQDEFVFRSLKISYSEGESHRIGDIMNTILEYKSQGVSFAVLSDPTKSVFNSPDFLCMVFEKNHYPISEPYSTQLLKSRTREGNLKDPQYGSILFYPGGYAMLFLKQTAMSPSMVIGMTPYGILALSPDFATPIECRTFY